MPASPLSPARRPWLPAANVPVETCSRCLRLIRPVPLPDRALPPWDGLAVLLEMDARARHRAALLRATRRRSGD